MHEERLSSDEMKRFKNMLTEQNLADFILNPDLLKKTHQIDTWINDDPDNKTMIMD